MDTTLDDGHRLPLPWNPTLLDFISGLTDDVLCYILSLLPMKDAVSTSVLSRRWRYLWTSIVSLDFDQTPVFGIGELGDFHEWDELSCDQALMFVNSVDQLLVLHQGPLIETLRICYPLWDEHGHHVDRWISLAMEKHAKKLDLNFGKIPEHCAHMNIGFPKRRYSFPHELFSFGRASSLKQLHLSNCTLILPVHFDGFGHLTTLSLEDVRVEEGIFEDVISSCLNLEVLSLTGCYSRGEPGDLKIACFSLRLKQVKISECSCTGLIICATNLVSLECSGTGCCHLTDHKSGGASLLIGGPCSHDNLASLSPSNFHVLKSLRTLILNDLDLEEEHVHSILSSCFHLERLSLTMHKKEHLKISMMHGLKYLEVEFYCELKVIEIYLPCLLSCKVTSREGSCLEKASVFLLDGATIDEPPTESKVFSTLRNLQLHNCVMKPDLRYIGFNSLTSLALDTMDIVDGHVEDLLLNCHFLERLSMRNCSKLVNLKISGLSLVLKYLELYKNPNLRTIKIWAVNLVTLEYHPGQWEAIISFKQVSYLTRIMMSTMCFRRKNGTSLVLKRLERHLPHLETLFLDSGSPIHVNIIPASSDAFVKLKKLVIIDHTKGDIVSFQWIVSLLRASPFLQHFELHLFYHLFVDYEPQEIIHPSKGAHKHLQEVRMSGFIGNKNEMEIVLYLLSNVTSLRQFTLDHKIWRYQGDDNWFLCRGCCPYSCQRRQFVRDWLFKLVPSHVKLSIS